ncbi:hypothetical protein NDU88_001496 [Pleurodeles waltl]|uniref:Uncharacterized protein n=1 Tax=Pleurodeles waltl TaxID=8319 RepID=A0AAV7VBM7_PLEWA|nr:hypothetical protein NDU88_001496 [Pleurodeles waltl]
MTMEIIPPIDSHCIIPTARVTTPLTMAVAINCQAEDKEGADRVGEDKGDTWMDVVEVSTSEMCVLLDVVMMVAAVDAVQAGVSVDVTVREEEEEGETVEAVDVVVCATEDEIGNASVAVVDPEDSEDEEVEDEDVDNRTLVIRKYFQ